MLGTNAAIVKTSASESGKELLITGNYEFGVQFRTGRDKIVIGDPDTHTLRTPHTLESVA
jgi:hypothetical protein